MQFTIFDMLPEEMLPELPIETLPINPYNLKTGDTCRVDDTIVTTTNGERGYGYMMEVQIIEIENDEAIFQSTIRWHRAVCKNGTEKGIPWTTGKTFRAKLSALYSRYKT